MGKRNTDKQAPKNPRLNVQLNDEQKDFMRLFYEYDVNFLIGDFGSGKSLAACYAALMGFRKRQFDKIWITRPMLKNNLAALPGTLEEKMQPYVFPILQNLNTCQSKQTTEKMLQDGDIQIMPIEVAKGITFTENSCTIVDEFQDCDYADFRTILTRLGKNAKIIFCGSVEQIDDKIGKNSCIYKVLSLENSGLVGFKKLTSNHRNSALTDIIKYLEK